MAVGRHSTVFGWSTRLVGIAVWAGEAWETFCERVRVPASCCSRKSPQMRTVTARLEEASPEIDQHFQNQKSRSEILEIMKIVFGYFQI